jgi:hypothetical protein
MVFLCGTKNQGIAAGDFGNDILQAGFLPTRKCFSQHVAGCALDKIRQQNGHKAKMWTEIIAECNSLGHLAPAISP